MFRFAAPFSALALCLSASAAQAGAFTDDLTKCIARSATENDQKTLVIWIFTAVSQHADARALANINPSQRETLTRQTAGLMQRLMTIDCRKETIAAIKYEGTDAIEAAFGALGEIAMTTLMNDPDVAKALAGLGPYLDMAKFEELGREAGGPAPKK